MIKVVPFEFDHYRLLTPDPDVHGHENHLWLKKVANNENYMAASFVKDGRCLGIIGFYSPVKGLAKCWAILSKEIKNYPFVLYRSVKQCIDRIFSFGVIKVLEADILTGNVTLQKWITQLGFAKEYSFGRYDVFVRRS